MFWLTIYTLGFLATWLALRRLSVIRVRILYASLLWPAVWPLAAILYATLGREEIERRWREMEK